MKLAAWTTISLAVAALLYLKGPWLSAEAGQQITGPQTVAQRLEQYGATADGRLKPDFLHAGVAYPPADVILVVLKQEKKVLLYATDKASAAKRYICSYPILAASGHSGPKLRQGDEQVPEGLYRVESLNPNSHYHLSLHVNYPNAIDLAHARTDGRTDLGGDIMIHGSDVSIGCVALGDPASEDLFVLAARTGLPNILLIFSPCDLRTIAPDLTGLPPWTPQLYADLKKALLTLPLPPQKE